MSGASATPRAAGNSTLRVTLLLALVLLLLGGAGAGAMALLQHAIRPPTADDVAQLVCTTYTTRNYDVLFDAVDPTPAPPTASGAFDAAAKLALRNKLQSLDASSGAVTSCSYKGPLFADVNKDTSHKRYVFTLQRARVSTQFTMPMTLVLQASGGWKISRDSDFTGLTG